MKKRFHFLERKPGGISPEMAAPRENAPPERGAFSGKWGVFFVSLCILYKKEG